VLLSIRDGAGAPGGPPKAEPGAGSAGRCYARDARVTRNTRWSQIVTIDIIRRDTLAASQSVPSPLPGLRATHHARAIDPAQPDGEAA
jgi:hypothetical protein